MFDEILGTPVKVKPAKKLGMRPAKPTGVMEAMASMVQIIEDNGLDAMSMMIEKLQEENDMAVSLIKEHLGEIDRLKNIVKRQDEVLTHYIQTEAIDKPDQPVVGIITRARNIILQAFKDDPGFYEAYHANVAMLLKDYQNWGDDEHTDLKLVTYPTPAGFKTLFDFDKQEIREFMAHRILKLIFE